MSIPMIYPAMQKLVEEIGSIGKTRKNPQQGYNFRGIDDCLNNLQPALLKARVFLVPRIVEMSREERASKSGGVLIYTTVKGEYDFVSSEDGSKVTAITFGEGMDSSDKSLNKAMSGALKYAIIQTLSIPTEELIDSERDTHEPAAKASPKSEKQAQGTTASPPAQAEKPAESLQATFIPERVSSKSGTKANGKEWTLYGIYDGKNWYNTFNEEFAEKAQMACNDKLEIKVFYTAGPRGKDVEVLDFADAFGD